MGPRPIHMNKGGITNIGGNVGKTDMFAKEKSVGVSDKGKKFSPAKLSAKPFGFGKKQKQGMKGRPVNYGSV